MVPVLLIFVIGLAVAAIRTKDRLLRWLWGGAALLNLLVAVSMVSNDDPFAFRLRPDDGYYERDYRR